MSHEWWDEDAATFAAAFAEVSTGVHHTPDIRIEQIEGGVYRLSIDREQLHLTATDLQDLAAWIASHRRELEQEAEAAQEYADSRKFMLHHYEGGD